MLRDWGLALLIAGTAAWVIGWVWGGPRVPSEAPDLELMSPAGTVISLDEYRDRTVVLNFWASWCGPCRAEVPELNKLQSSHPEVALVGIAVDSGGPNEVERSARRLGIAYPVVLATAEAAAAYDVGALPMTVVIQPDRRVSDVRVGALSHTDLVEMVSH